MNLSFKNKIILSIAILIFLFTSLTIFLVNRNVKSSLNEKTIEKVNRVQSFYTSNEADKIQEILTIAMIISEIPVFKALISARKTEQVKEAAFNFSKLAKSSLYIITDKTGEIIASDILDKKTLKEIEFNDYLKKAFKNGQNNQTFFIGNKSYKFVTIPVKTGNHIFGSLTFGFEISDEFVSTISQATKSKIIFLKESEIIASTIGEDEKKYFMEQVKKTNHFQAIGKNISLVERNVEEKYLIFQYLYKNIHYYGMYHFTNEPLKIIILVSVQEDMNSLYSLQKRIFITGALLIAIGFLLTILLSRSLVQSIEALIEGTGKIVEGDYDHKINIKTHDEIQGLAEAFNNMIDVINNSKLELQTYADNLEYMVEERTQELQIKNLDLDMQRGELQIVIDEFEQSQIELKKQNHKLQLLQEELKERAEQLELSNKYKSEFFANISHELRTPLNSILVLSKLLSSGASGIVTEKQAEQARTIYSSGSDLLQMVNEILDFAKMETGKMKLNPSILECKPLCDNLYESLVPLANEKEIDFAIKHDNKLETIYSDIKLLKQMMKNLISNAIKFTKKGSVTVEVFSCEEDETFFTIKVIDTGIGIPKEKMKSIWEPFHQADGSTSREYGGTGLGLSITKQAVELLQGQITLESDVGKGSTFTVILPKKVETIQEQEKGTEKYLRKQLQDENTVIDAKQVIIAEQEATFTADSPLEHDELLDEMSVLIIDSNFNNGYEMAVALEKSGINALQSESCEETLDSLENWTTPDFIILIPNKFDDKVWVEKLIEKVKAPVIAIVKEDETSLQKELQETGVSEIMNKPIKLLELLDKMKALINNKNPKT
ncbi:MAG: HAMP domain-containing protein [Nitrospinae bacterium]|nr:HAMP domain-containing protein [Nitrospinota bacterium]